jgi:hypothetical protein
MPGVRLAVLLAFGALSVHQLRYLIGGSSGGPDHAYLAPLSSVLAGAAMVALAQLLARVARGRAGLAPRLRVLWGGASLTLATVYCLQELAEGVSPVGHGGWVAFPLAALVALGIAVLTRGASRAKVAARRPWGTPAPLVHPVLPRLGLALQARRAAPRLLPARGPPSASA